ncbi:MAG: hypothetical protein Q9O62_14650 [Ardenticatenia bacterium]|nr:hypothetical protein [Ardenticatenia bacterium]
MIDSGMISKIQKAKEYADEPHRIQFLSFKVQFDGKHDGHMVTYQQGTWYCDCHYFQGDGVCSHTMAMERILGVMVPQPAVRR